MFTYDVKPLCPDTDVTEFPDTYVFMPVYTDVQVLDLQSGALHSLCVCQGTALKTEDGIKGVNKYIRTPI